MTGWAGINWQFFDDEDTQTRIGVTFGLGLLDEELAATGSLSIALAALRAELARPVELGAGRTGFPEVLVELGSDTSTLTIRGATDTVGAAWRRLPGLFAGWIVTDQIDPARPEHPVWPADLVQRTGRNAAALAGFQVSATDARERARVLLSRLDPASGRTRAVFFTTAESLIGSGFAVQEADKGPAPELQWADGTPRRTATGADGVLPEGLDALAKPATGNGPGSLPVSEETILLSTLVPRSASGLAAAELLRAKLAETATHAGLDPDAIGIGMLGLGAEFCVFLRTEGKLAQVTRQRVLKDFGRSMALVPDPWVEDAVRHTDHRLSPRLARERRVLGLADDAGADTGRVRQALIEATRFLHLALDPGTHDPRSADRPKRSGSEASGRERTFRSLPTGDVSTGRPVTLVVGQGALALRTRVAEHGGGTMHETRIAVRDALAVLEDPAGTLAVVDRNQQVLTFHPRLFKHHRSLQQLLDPLLDGLPRLGINNDADPAGIALRLRRAKRPPAWLLAGAVALAGFLVIPMVASSLDEPQVTARITIGETAQLGNGTTITATGFDRIPAAAGERETQVAVQVRFCAGGDTGTGEFPPETQRSVAPADFVMLNEQYVSARLVDSDSQLRRDTLQEGQCAVGDLVFQGEGLSVPRLAYKNPFGDDVVWYTHGKVPPAPVD